MPMPRGETPTPSAIRERGLMGANPLGSTPLFVGPPKDPAGSAATKLELGRSVELLNWADARMGAVSSASGAAHKRSKWGKECFFKTESPNTGKCPRRRNLPRLHVLTGRGNTVKTWRRRICAPARVMVTLVLRYHGFLGSFNANKGLLRSPNKD